MSKARELSQRAGVDGALSNRNLIINGAMQVAQRGTSVSAGSANTYTLDRWIARSGVVSQETEVPTGKGFKNSALYDNAGTRSSINMRQVIEDGVTRLNGQDVTISFWVKTSVTTSIGVDLHDTYSSNYTLSCPANEWVYHTYTVTNVDTSLFTDYWSGPHAHVDFNFGTDYPDVYLTGVQLEVGDTATPFEHRSFGQELSLCQRFYQKTFRYDVQPAVGNTSYYVPANAWAYASNDAWVAGNTSFITPMRTSPSLTVYSQQSGATTGQIGVFNGSNWFNATASTHGISDNAFLLAFNPLATGSKLVAFNYTADAELYG